MNRRIPALVAATSMACLMLWSLPAHADDTAAKSDLVTQQKQVRAETDQATADLNALILEYNRNGLGDGADVQILNGISKALAGLSQKDMEKVLALLEKARTSDPHTATKALADAFSGQKGISTQLSQLLIQYQHEQDLADIALRLTRLADRENQNMRSGTSLYRSAKGASPKSYNDIQKAQLQVEQSEQQAIYAEAKVLIERLGSLADQADDTTKDHLKAVVAGAEKEKLIPQLSGAADDLHNSNLFSAVGKERTARDVLRDLARLAAPAKDPEDVLKEAVAQLNQAIRDQNYIAKQAKEIKATDKDNTDTIAQLDDRAADNVDIADSVRKDVAAITPDAVPDLKKAGDTIQSARKDLTDLKGKDAADQAAAAAQQLMDARQKLQDQVARIEEQKNADNKIAKEKALLDQIVALRKSQELLQKDTIPAKDTQTISQLTPRQIDLAKHSHDLQQTAVTDSPAVAPVLENASKDMDSAHSALDPQANATEAVKSQQMAVDELKKAEAMLAQEIATLEKEKQDLAKLEKARDQVAQMIKDQAKTEQQTNKQAANDNKPKPNDPAPQDLAKQENNIAKQANDTAKDVADTAQDAAKDLANAAQNADTAAKDLNTPDAKSADPQEKQAASNLDKAKTNLDQQIAKMQKDLDEQNDDAAKLADAANKIDQAETDLDNANQPDPTAQLADTQKKIAADAKNLPQDQPDVQAAAKAADDAAKDLANNDLDKAADDMNKAADDMQKAQAAAKTPAAAKAALPDLGKRQDDAKKQLAAIKSAQAPDPAAALDDAGDQAADAQADDGSALPADANAALADAKAALSDAAAAKAAGKPDAGAAAKAKAALDKAKGAVAMAQAGLGAGEEAKGPGQGPPEPGQKGDQPGKPDENGKGGKGERIDSTVNADSKTGPAAATNGASSFAALPRRDRDAIQQSRSEKVPEEYSPMIQQYLKNLSDQNTK